VIELRDSPDNDFPFGQLDTEANLTIRRPARDTTPRAPLKAGPGPGDILLSKIRIRRELPYAPDAPSRLFLLRGRRGIPFRPGASG
jgi:hypothetical protein